MKIPFPGMDPYLEEPNLWSDVHVTLIVAMRGALNAVLPKGYIAAADKYVWIHEPDADARTRVVKPDGFIVKSHERVEASAPVAIRASTTVVLPAIRREGNKYLKIMDSRSRRLITVVELLSPSNKQPGPDREDYLTKRMDYLTAGVNLVEIDLHRGGQRLPLAEPQPAGFDYYALVCRPSQMPRAEIWPFTVRDPFPVISIPLGPDELGVSLDLRPCLEWAYEQGKYGEEVNYRLPAVPPLSPADAEWAKSFLPA
ncbi:MAG: DUF4058 family protein [Pirellulaceae bacterium]|nr:DUF4058 family protein [Pirellulaceae bacterium]